MKNIKLKYLIPFIFFTISMVVSLGIYFFNIDRALKTEENKFIELAKYRAIERQGIIEALLRKDDIAELRRIFNIIGAAKDLEYALLIDENEKIIISTKRMFAEERVGKILNEEELALYKNIKSKDTHKIIFSKDKESLYLFFPVFLNSTKGLGDIKIGHHFEKYSTKRIKKEISSSEIRDAILPSLVFFLAILGLYFIFYISIAKNIKKIIVILERFSKGDSDVRCEMDGKNEISLFAQNIDKMINKIEQSSKELEQYKKALNEIDIVSKSDLDGNITYVNQKFCNSTGYTRQELIGKPHNIIRHPDTPKEVFKELWETIRAKKTWKKTIKNRKKNGDYYWVDVMIMPILDSKNEIIEYIAARHDVTELIDQRRELETLISTDTLTGLGNRFRLVNDIQTSLSPSLALINIDNFREINDFYGHKIGDFVIIELGNLIFERFNSSDYSIYHIQGDEYAVLYQKDDKASFYKKVEEATLSIGSSDVEISIHKIAMQLTASISFEDKSSLLTTVDMALKYAKKSRKNIIVYDKTLELDKEYKKNIEWTIKLKNAINNDRITVFYQPIVNNKDGQREKYECLVRMIDEDSRIISPYFFLDIAKRSKLYTKITEKVIEKSFQEFRDKNCEFSINLNIQDILDKNLIKYLDKMIKDYNIEGRLVFEIVENEGIENFDEVKQFIKNAKSCGCKVAIDDFGTGYSNFEYLMQLEADYIKIDGSMIKNIATNENSRLVVETIVDFAKKMNIKTIAEFVKDEEIYKKVKELGIDYSQGYHLGEPLQNPN